MASRLRLLYASIVALALSPALFPSPAPGNDNKPRLVVAGAQSLMPLAESFSAQFQKEHPGVQIQFWAGGSNYAIQAVRSGLADVGLVARSLAPSEQALLRVETLGQDAIILLTYPGNTVTGVTLAELRDIYRGRIANWKELGGQDKGVVPLTRERTSAIHAIFLERLFGRYAPGEEKAFTIRASKEKVLRTIKRIEGAVGYGIVRLDEAGQQGVKVLAVEGALPTPANIQSGHYHFVRPQLVVTRAGAKGLAGEWSDGFRAFAQKSMLLGARQ